jgi:nicotinamide-nucleotide amidase
MTPLPCAPRRAVIIAVGAEMLTPFRTDTNSLFITARLNEIGIEVFAKLIVGDARESVASLVSGALQRADLVILTGGLGPTADDVTRLGAADALGVAIDEDPVIVERIRARFARRGLEMPEVNRTQAQVLRGAVVLANPNGTAPGQWFERDGRAVVMLPGPPREMKPMFEAVVAEHLAPRTAGARLYRRMLRIAGRTESHVEEIAEPIYSAWLSRTPPISTSILAAPGQIELHFSVRSDSAESGEAALDRATDEMIGALGADVFSTDGRTLEQVVGDRLRAKGWRVATAESCTGGLVASRLTDVPGSSDYVDRGVVCYSNAAKVDLLGVPPAMLAQYGAVSEPVGRAMAEGLRERAGVDIAVGITGIAGPGGGTEEKPVGTVVIAVAWVGGSHVEPFLFPGGREQVKFQASQAALNMLRKVLNDDATVRRG